MNSIRLKNGSKLRMFVPLFVVLSIILTACGGAATPTTAPVPTATTAASAAAAPTNTALAPTQAHTISNAPAPAPMLTPVPLDRWKVATIPVGTNNTSMAEGAGMIWLDTNDGFQKIDPVTSQVTTITTVNKPGPNIVSDGAVWVVDNHDPNIGDTDAAVLKKLDPASGKVEATIALGDYVGDCCTGIAATDGAIWLASFITNRILKISTQTNSIVATIPASGPLCLAAGGGSVWVCNHHAHNKDSDPAD